MEQFVGESFDGVISGVTTWGMYVELPNTIEGMIRVADIPGDYYYFAEEKYQMVGERTGKVYKLGEPIRITVSAVDRITNSIDFVIADAEEGNVVSGKERNVSGVSEETTGQAGHNGRKEIDPSGIGEKQRKAEEAFAQLVEAKKAGR